MAAVCAIQAQLARCVHLGYVYKWGRGGVNTSSHPDLEREWDEAVSLDNVLACVLAPLPETGGSRTRNSLRA